MTEKITSSLMDEQTRQMLDQLVALLGENQAIQRFKRAEAQVNRNQRLVTLQAEIIEKQKAAANFAYYDKTQAQKETDQEVNQLTSELNEHPLVLEYQTALQEANAILQMVVQRLQLQVTSKMDQFEEKGKPKDAAKD